MISFLLLCISLVSSAVKYDKKYNWTNVSHLLNPQLLNQDVVSKLLPNIYILPFDDIYSVKCDRFLDRKPTKPWDLHDHDVWFHQWLLNDYNRTVNNGKDAQLYFVPVYVGFCITLKYSHGKWEKINKELEKLYSNRFSSNRMYSKELTFITASTPSHTLMIKLLNHRKIDFLQDMRYQRIDNFGALNGREIIIPYYINATNFPTPIIEERKNFIFLPGNQPPGKSDTEREFRNISVLNFPNDINSLIFNHTIERKKFDHYLYTSDFCFILPGDTPGTLKLFKSIMSGCIPVYFISYKEQLPFYKFINWSKFTILVQKEATHSKEKMAYLRRYLMNLRNDKNKLYEMKQYLMIATRFFDYGWNKWPSVYHFMVIDLFISSGSGSNLLNNHNFKDWRNNWLRFPNISETSKLNRYLR